MRTMTIHGAGWMTLALACAFTAAPAMAQNAATDSASAKGYVINVYPSASLSGAAGDLAPPTAGAADESALPNESVLPGDALIFDPATFTATAPAKPLRLPSLSDPRALDVSRADAPGGSGPVVVKQPLPTDWETSAGADLNPATSATGFRPPMPVTRDTGGSGTAWVQVGVPHFATLDARVDPSIDQRKLGTTFKQPIGSKFALTLQNSYSVTETNGVPTAAPSDFPLMTAPRVPVTSTATTPRAPVTSTPTQIWGNENLAKVDFLPTGTSFSAGLTTASNDPVTHNKLSAEQRLYGPLHVTTAVTDMGQPTESKSITAGVRLSW